MDGKAIPPAIDGAEQRLDMIIWLLTQQNEIMRLDVLPALERLADVMEQKPKRLADIMEQKSKPKGSK